MQGGRAPGGVEGGPAEVHGGADVPVAVQHDQPVGDVGDQEADGADGEQLEGAADTAARHDQTEQQGQHHDVAQRVGDRDGLLEPVELGVPRVGEDQVDPDQQRQAHGEDQRVQQTGPVLMRGPPADEAQHACRVQQVLGEVEAVGDGRERAAQVQELHLDDLDHLARREAEVGEREQVPVTGVRGAVEADADHDGGDAAQADARPPDDPLGGIGVVDAGEQHHPRQVTGHQALAPTCQRATSSATSPRPPAVTGGGISGQGLASVRAGPGWSGRTFEMGLECV